MIGLSCRTTEIIYSAKYNEIVGLSWIDVCTCLGSSGCCSTHSTFGTLHNLNKQFTQNQNTSINGNTIKIWMHDEMQSNKSQN